MANFGPAALELCSLATGGTQEMAEIAEIIKIPSCQSYLLSTN